MDPASITLLSFIGMSFIGACCAIYQDLQADQMIRIRIFKRNKYRSRKPRRMIILSPIPEGVE
jgi:hypothetical protein